MAIEVLIRGDYLYFCIGNLISDTSLALLAILSWRNNSTERILNGYSYLLSDGFTRNDMVYLRTSLALFDETKLNNITFATPADRQFIYKSIKKLKYINNLCKLFCISFIIGVLTQIIAISYSLSIP